MKSTTIARRFFRGVFNGRIDDQAIVSAVAATTASGLASSSAAAASSSSSSSNNSTAVPYRHFDSINAYSSFSATAKAPKAITDKTFQSYLKGDGGADSTVSEAEAKECTIYIARLVSSTLHDLGVTAARHSTAVSEFDQFLCHTQTTQRHLAVIETSRYALDALTMAVAEDAEDAVFINIFARLALEQSVQAANAIFGLYVANHRNSSTASLLKAVPHPSDTQNKEVAIDYSVFEKAEALLASFSPALVGTAFEARAVRAVMGEFLGKDSPKVKPVSMFSKSPLHMSPTHSNATGYVTQLQDELASFPSAVLKAVKPTSSDMQCKKVGEICADYIATVAVLHRYSAAISNDVEGEGRVQASIAPVFCLLSSARRQAALRTMLSTQSGKNGATVAYDDIAVHPTQFVFPAKK